NFFAEFTEFRPAMIDDRHRDCLQHPLRYIGRPWDLQEMPAGMDGSSVLHRVRLRGGRLIWTGAGPRASREKPHRRSTERPPLQASADALRRSKSTQLSAAISSAQRR